jgi:hypothetical protein
MQACKSLLRNKENFVTLLAVVAMVSCGGGGGSGNAEVLTSNSATASISTNAIKVFLGDSAVLTWSSTNASSCTASGDWSGTKPISGSETVATTNQGDQFFAITCGDASSNVTVTVSAEDFEGSCLNPHISDIPHSYIGEYEIPMPQNSFGDDHLKSIGFKDYGVRWVYRAYENAGASWIADCTEDEYTKLMYRMTLRRLKEHGVTTTSIYNFGYWNDVGAWEVDHSTMHLSDADIKLIALTAENLGVGVHYAWQFNMRVAGEQRLLFPFDGNVKLDMPLLKKIMDAHEGHILWEADRLEDLDIGSMSADWSAMWLCFSCGVDGQGHTQAQTDELKDYYMERMGGIIDQIKEKFSGKVYVAEGLVWNDKRVFDKVDGVGISFDIRLNADEVETATVALLQERAAQSIQNTYEEWHCLNAQPCWHNSSSTIPKVIFNFFSQSNTRFLSKGWWEDGFCTTGALDGVNYECTQYEIQTDFSAQAIFTEAVLRAIDTQGVFETLGTTTTTGYWLSDTLLAEPNQQPSNGVPLEGFPNISQSVRGKPAEKIIKYWYTGEYEKYDPQFID